MIYYDGGWESSHSYYEMEWEYTKSNRDQPQYRVPLDVWLPYEYACQAKRATERQIKEWIKENPNCQLR